MKVSFKMLMLCTIALGTTFIACERDNDIVQPETSDFEVDVPVTEITDGEIIIDNTLRERVTDQAILDLVAYLELDVAPVTKGPFHLPDGTVEERLFVGNDAVTTKEELEFMKSLMDSGDSRQYRTFNLVTGANRTINILGYVNNDQFTLSNKAQTALQWAVNNYNRLSGVSLNFNLSYGSNFQAADMVVYDNSINNPGNSGGVAGFPNGQGQPNKFIQIYNIEQFSTNVNEHVITHEIGHSVGFRHSDWFDRLSCPPSSQGNEGSGSVGAVHVPGTPTGRDLTSVMQACFATNEDGEFNGNDITALRFMY